MPESDDISHALGRLETKAEMILKLIDKVVDNHDHLAREVAILHTRFDIHAVSPHPTPSHIELLDREVRNETTNEAESIKQGFARHYLALSVMTSFVLLTLLGPFAQALIQTIIKHWGP